MIALALRYWHFVAIAALVALLGLSQVKLSAEKEAHANTRGGHAEVLRDLADKTLKVYQAAVADDEARKKATAALDAKHTKELNDEKAKLEKLRADVAAGRVGLRVNATCTSAAGTDVPPATGATSVDDATGPRLTDAAQRDYFTLRAGVETSRKQIEGLQDYIRSVCLK